jgi:hypothetical protein
LRIQHAAALRIFRDVFFEYESLLELGPKEQTELVRQFLIDFDKIFVRTIGNNGAESILQQVQQLGEYERVVLGRRLATSILWPAETYFRRTKQVAVR